MSLVDAVRTCFQKYVVFTGRARPSEYWWWVLFSFIVIAVGSAIDQNVGVVVYLALVLPSLAVFVRRMHDTGRSGWWFFLGLIPLVGPIILIVWLASAGDPAPNEYGDPPGPGPSSAPA